MSDNGSIYTCKQHSTLRWFTTKPGGVLIFHGEVKPDGTLKPASVYGIPPLTYLRHRLNGRNPFAPELESPDEPPMTWDALVSLVRHLDDSTTTYSYECPCPATDLVVVEGETYEDLPQ